MRTAYSASTPLCRVEHQKIKAWFSATVISFYLPGGYSFKVCGPIYDDDDHDLINV